MLPRLHLAIDNCFAAKRWTDPRDWMQIAADCGLFAVEASADTEADPLYQPADVLAAWADDVLFASAQTGVRVVNLYSGHSSYTTLGLTHPDIRVRDHLEQRWLAPMIQTASVLGAGLGFFMHAIPQPVLAEPPRYAELESDLLARLGRLAQAAAAAQVTLSVEQMYSPHQPPFTIGGARRWLEDVYLNSRAPLYLTLDTGHWVGQRHFLPPTFEDVIQYVTALVAHMSPPGLWLGGADLSARAREWSETLAPDAVAARLMTLIAERAYVFASAEDGDVWAWVRAFGAHAPIIHLQQTDGSASAHRPFTARYNASGQITPDRLFAALRAAYGAPATLDLPPRVTDLYLTLELFSGTADRPDDILRAVRESAGYWRAALPKDGLTLDQV